MGPPLPNRLQGLTYRVLKSGFTLQHQEEKDNKISGGELTELRKYAGITSSSVGLATKDLRTVLTLLAKLANNQSSINSQISANAGGK